MPQALNDFETQWRHGFSPVLRQSVDVIEAVLIASVLPLALGVLDLYNAFRAL